MDNHSQITLILCDRQPKKIEIFGAHLRIENLHLAHGTRRITARHAECETRHIAPAVTNWFLWELLGRLVLECDGHNVRPISFQVFSERLSPFSTVFSRFQYQMDT